MSARAIVWLRRDLRLQDNAAIAAACTEHEQVALAFVVDPPLLASPRMGAPLVCAFFDALAALRESLREMSSDLTILCGDHAEELSAFAQRIGARALYYGEDYEPAAIARDAAVTQALRERGIRAQGVLDHVYFGADEVARADGSPFRVFTPYKRRWLERRAELPRSPVRSLEALRTRTVPANELDPSGDVPSPARFGFARKPGYQNVTQANAEALLDSFAQPGGGIERYAGERNHPALRGTSRLSPHLRAGTVGIRTCVERAFARRAQCDPAVRANVDAWIGELIWRDFYQTILKRFPHVVDTAFLPAAEGIAWRDAPDEFGAWCQGRTGYPLVDAAMRDLNANGWMHNRLRMLAASFLSKHLLIDWRLGERYFERHLSDAETASNNGGWQWAASVGTDAVPYFRIFNPAEQGRRFDPDGAYVRRFVPELAQAGSSKIHEPEGVPGYPAPIVEHRAARMRALAAYGAAFARAKDAPGAKA